MVSHNVLLNGGNDRAVVEAGRALKVQEERAEIHVDRTDHRRIIVGHDGFRVQSPVGTHKSSHPLGAAADSTNV